MDSTSLINYAILLVNWEEHKKDYIENFFPFFVEAIRRTPNDQISLPVLKETFSDAFRYNLPSMVFERLLKKAYKREYLRIDHGIYIKNHSLIDTINFDEKRNIFIGQFNDIISALIKFATKYSQTWDEDYAEKSLISYLRKNKIAIDREPIEDGLTRGTKYIVGVFVKQLHEEDSRNFEHLVEISKGLIIADALFISDPDGAKTNFHKTEVYLDTTFLMYALGYSGEEMKASFLGLLNLLKYYKANLKCFRHTYVEIKRILDALSYRFENGRQAEAYGPSVEYFLSKGYSSSDIMVFSSRIERDLNDLDVTIEDVPEYTVEEREHVIGEAQLNTLLTPHIEKEDTRDRDVKSVSAIARLRKGKTTNHIEDCVAIFITTNNALVMRSTEMYYQEEKNPKESLPLCVTSYHLLSKLWLKNPFKAPELPMKYIISDCIAATEPSPKLWAKYVDKIQQLRNRADFKKENYYYLRYSIDAKAALMELTVGDEEAFTDGTIDQILKLQAENIRKEILDEKNKEIEKKEQLIGDKELEIEGISKKYEEEKRKREQKEQIEERMVRKTSRRIIRSVKLTYALLLIGVSSVALYDCYKGKFSVAGILLLSAIVVVDIFSVYDSLQSGNINTLTKWVGKTYYNWKIGDLRSKEYREQIAMEEEKERNASRL